MTKFLYLVLIILISNFAFSQDVEVIAENGKFIIDADLQLIVCNKDISGLGSLNGINSLTLNLDGNDFLFNNIPNELENGVQYQVSSSSQTFTLYFSATSLINISTAFDIADEPKVLADFVLTDSTDAAAIVSYCGIEYRGGFSQSFPKKSYDLELWDDMTGDDNNKLPLLNMRNDDDWLLLAMYNEPLRIRNGINHKLWLDIHTPYYINQEADAKSGVKTKYVELAVNNEYMGIYMLTEQVDKKQLKLAENTTSIKSELYKGYYWGGAVTFTELPSYDNSLPYWGGFKIKYPKDSDDREWQILYNFIDFVMNSSDNDFEQNIANEFALENAIDYFILLNLLRSTDNVGKNLFIARYKENEPYFYVPWDLDGTFGIIWNGQQVNIYDDILSNGFYDRLLQSNDNLFNTAALNRWEELRSDVLETNNLIDRIYQPYNYLVSNAVYDREALKWGTSSLDLTNLDYTNLWLQNRLNFLDTYFDSITSIEYPINKETNVYPNPVISTFKVGNMPGVEVFYNIFDIGGSVVKKGTLNKDELINISELSRGMYFIRLTNNDIDYDVSFKLIKQ